MPGARAAPRAVVEKGSLRVESCLRGEKKEIKAGDDEVKAGGT